MLNRTKNPIGFGIIEIILFLAMLGLVGALALFAVKNHDKNTTQTGIGLVQIQTIK